MITKFFMLITSIELKTKKNFLIKKIIHLYRDVPVEAEAKRSPKHPKEAKQNEVITEYNVQYFFIFFLLFLIYSILELCTEIKLMKNKKSSPHRIFEIHV